VYVDCYIDPNPDRCAAEESLPAGLDFGRIAATVVATAEGEDLCTRTVGIRLSVYPSRTRSKGDYFLYTFFPNTPNESVRRSSANG